jgi:thioredoxin 1
MIQYATDDTFDSLISEGVVLVDFFGKFCGPCKLVARELEEIDDELPFVNIVKVDTDDCPKTSERYHISGIPDLYFYKDGKLVHHELGAINGDAIRTILGGILYE